MRKSAWLLAAALTTFVMTMLAAVIYTYNGVSFTNPISNQSSQAAPHFSFLMFRMAIRHGISSGTDTSMLWAQAVYWSFGGSFLFLAMLRMVVHVGSKFIRTAPYPARRVQTQPVPANQDSIFDG
ncbi:MAG TPA: hypothetical protein VLX61_14410 [Anaerolineales bacterium]|nr:hypothetical protein [Anaerolineales bacterium]